MRYLCAILAVCLSAVSPVLVFAQCENGQCRTPVRSAFRTAVQAQPVRSAAKGVYQSVGAVKSYGCTGSAAASYGSNGGSGYSMSSSQVIVTYGCVGSSVAPASTVEVLGFKQRRASRSVIVSSAEQAHAAGSITDAQLQTIKLASHSPRMLARMEDLILSQAQASGAYSFALDADGEVVKAAVDWDKIGDFILKIAPMIFKLIELYF